MHRNNNEQPPPSGGAEDEFDPETWKQLEAAMLGGKTADEREAALREMHNEETRIRQQELLERVFQLSDLLVQAPDDFPDRRYLKHVVSAMAVTLQSRPRRFCLRDAVGQLNAALAIVTAEHQELEEEFERQEDERFGPMEKRDGGNEE
jgi:hypothetical protein